MSALVGFPIYEKSTKDLEDEGFLVPTKCIFIRTTSSKTAETFSDFYTSYIVNNEQRNSLVCQVVQMYRKTNKLLILTRRVKHAKMLGELIPNSFVITGSTDKVERKEMFNKFKASNDFVLIGSTKIFSAGIDIPDLNIIINTTGHKSNIDTIQITGRVKRKYGNKLFGYYVDFLDEVKFFKTASKLRIKKLKEFGNEVKIINSIDELKNLII